VCASSLLHPPRGGVLGAWVCDCAMELIGIHDWEALALSIVMLSDFILGVFNHVGVFCMCLVVEAVLIRAPLSLLCSYQRLLYVLSKSFPRVSSCLSKQKLLDSHESLVHTRFDSHASCVHRKSP
jgi:hypothetical protein